MVSNHELQTTCRNYHTSTNARLENLQSTANTLHTINLGILHQLVEIKQLLQNLTLPE